MPQVPSPTREQRQQLDSTADLFAGMHEAAFGIAKNVGRDGGPASPPAGTPAPPPACGEAGAPPTQGSDDGTATQGCDDGTEPPAVIWG